MCIRILRPLVVIVQTNAGEMDRATEVVSATQTASAPWRPPCWKLANCHGTTAECDNAMMISGRAGEVLHKKVVKSNRGRVMRKPVSAKIVMLLGFVFLFSGFMISCGSDVPFELWQVPDTLRDYPYCGEPVLDTAQEASGQAPELYTNNQEQITDWMDLLSESNVDYVRQLLAPLSEKEALLLEKVMSLVVPLVHRTHVASLGMIFDNGGIVSPRQLSLTDPSQIHITTPPLEDYLLGGWDCVFTAVGPPDGTARYGEIVIRVSSEKVLGTGWATPWSGYHFVGDVLHKDAAAIDDLLSEGLPLPTKPGSPVSLTLANKLQYADNIYFGEDWNLALGLSAIWMWRNNPDPEGTEKRVDEMLQTQSSHEFWSIFTEWNPDEGIEGFAYFEGKYPGMLSMDTIEAIEVPADEMDAVQKLDLYPVYKDLIHVQ
jgi:hypothetical protein